MGCFRRPIANTVVNGDALLPPSTSWWNRRPPVAIAAHGSSLQVPEGGLHGDYYFFLTFTFLPKPFFRESSRIFYFLYLRRIPEQLTSETWTKSPGLLADVVLFFFFQPRFQTQLDKNKNPVDERPSGGRLTVRPHLVCLRWPAFLRSPGWRRTWSGLGLSEN